jgi:hypothetical protein
MSDVPCFIGIDVAKAQLDIAVRPSGERWAVPKVRWPPMRLAWRADSVTAPSRWAPQRGVAVRALRALSRARVRARPASSAPWGTETAVRAPEPARRARGLAARRSVVTRSPACWGSSEGATTPQASSFFGRER